MRARSIPPPQWTSTSAHRFILNLFSHRRPLSVLIECIGPNGLEPMSLIDCMVSNGFALHRHGMDRVEYVYCSIIDMNWDRFQQKVS